MSKKNQNTELKNLFIDPKTLDKNVEAALYYGFSAIRPVSIDKEDQQAIKPIKNGEPIEYIGSNLDIKNIPEEKAAILREYVSQNLFAYPQPVMMLHEGYINENSKKTSGKTQKLDLEIF